MVTETMAEVVDPTKAEAHAPEDKAVSPGAEGEKKKTKSRSGPRSPKAIKPKVVDPATVVEPEMDVVTILNSIPEGNYKVISFAVDLTGKRTTDEICQIAAYVQPDKGYSQYVMPSCDVSLGASKNHGIRVYVLFGKYRILRSVWSRKILKTKSIFSTLNEFLVWLKEQKGTSDGVILTYHDHNHSNLPFFLSKAVHGFKMAEEYDAVVKAVVNCADLPVISAKADGDKGQMRKAANTLFTRLREGLTIDMDKAKLKQQLQSAKNRAEWMYKLHAKVFNCDDKEDLPFNELKKALITASKAAGTDDVVCEVKKIEVPVAN